MAAAAAALAAGSGALDETQLLPEGVHPLVENDGDAGAGDKPAQIGTMRGASAAVAGQGAGAGAHVPAARQRGRRRGWGLVFHSPYFRRACQCSCGVVVIMTLLSIPSVFAAIAVDPIMANGSLCLVLFFMVLLVSLATADAPIRVAAEQIVGSLGGGGVGVGAIYLTMAINGGTYRNTVAKAAAMVSLSSAAMFLSTVFRFRYKQATLIWQFFALTYAITTAASYHAESRQWEFTVFWFAYSAIGGAVAYLSATLVLPVTAGAIVRRRLAAGLELTSDALRQLVELVTGDVSPDSGLLAAASGETAERIGLDSGLYPQLQALYASATAAGQAIQVAYSHLDSAPLQLDVYRRQRSFPLKPWQLLTTLSRSLLNTVMLMVYPAQTGTMHCLLLARHRAPLLALAHAVEECCTALGDVFVQNAPVSAALEKLTAVEASYAALAAATRFKGSTLTQDRVALDMLLSMLFTACTRLRRMAVLLPEALGRDQPSSLHPVLDHFAPELEEGVEEGPFAGVAGAHGEVKWDFAALTQIPLTRQESNPIDLLRASLLAAQPRRSASRAAAELLAQPDVLRLPRAAPPRGRLHRSLAWLKARTGITPEHLALGLQMVAAYVPLLVMLIIPGVNATFDGHLVWALFVVVSVLQPSTGAAIFKGLQRLAGTVLAGALGVGSQYLVFLINGLSYENTALKFAAMTVVLALLAGLMAAASIKFPKYSYVFIIGNVVLAITALPGYQSNVTRPLVAVWRVANTALGVVVEVAAVSLVFPVTARQLFRATMAATLDRMAGVARTAFQALLPAPPRSSRAPRKQLPGGKSQGQGQGNGHAAAQQPGQQQLQQERKQQQPQRQIGVCHSHLGWQQQAEQQRQQQQRDAAKQQPGQQQAAPAAGEGMPSPFAQLLPALAAPPQQLVREDVVIEVQGGARVVLRSLRTKAVPRRSSSGTGDATALVLSPRSGGSGSVRRRRSSGGEQGGGEAATCASPRSEGRGSDVTAGMSIMATVGRAHTFKIIGSAYARLLPDAFSTSAGIVAMLGMGPALHYEFYPRSAIHRFQFDAGFRAQRLCRHMLNIVAGAVIVLDSHEVSGLPMLAPFAPRLEQLIEQLAACLEALAGMVRKQASPDKAVGTVLALEDHVQRLFLLVLSSDLPPGLDEADVINGLALLSVLINAVYVARLLALALIRCFHPSPHGSGPPPAEAALLARGSATRWAADDRTLQLGLGILGVAMGAGSTSAASASAGGGMTPLGATPRGATPLGASTPRGASPPGAGPRTPLWGGSPEWEGGSGRGLLGPLRRSGSGDGSLGSVLPGRPAM